MESYLAKYKRSTASASVLRGNFRGPSSGKSWRSRFGMRFKGSWNRRCGGLLIVRSLPVFSASLGVSGEGDVVEFHETPDGIALKGQSGLWQPYPVEYKRGSTASRPGTFFSFADRPCAWRRCSAARFLKGRCITGRPAAVSGFPFRKSFGGRFAPAIRCPFRLVLPRTGTAS